VLLVGGAGSARAFYVMVDAAGCGALPERCCAVEVSSKQRQALERLALHDAIACDAPDARQLLTGLRPSDLPALPIPLSPGGRLQPLLAALRDEPTTARGSEQWAADLGLSRRQLSRLFLAEVGLSFSSWRQLMRLRLAVERLAMGHDVQRVAREVGYESVSMFVAAFRRGLGTTPGQYARQLRGMAGTAAAPAEADAVHM